ncbi:MAG: DUF2249 domain-containing protein [Bacteroidota bacterium]|nr:DUF2249 domain-containing protein [Bacteroidota bacterium]
MNISATTKISELVKANPASIDAIITINKHFEKLRNPILRKILASRVTIADAAKIGGCTVNDFFSKLIPLGFSLAPDTVPIINSLITDGQRPAFMQKINSGNIITLDVRADLASGKDPFQRIMDTLPSLSQDNFLLIINTFEPVPLINVLKRKGFEYYTEEIQRDIFHTYFKNTTEKKIEKTDRVPLTNSVNSEFDEMLNKYIGKMETVDVRHLEMPLPMVTILQKLNTLQEGHSLFVQHKKIPQFLLPELEENKFSWLIREDGPGDVKLLIFR